MSIGLESDEMSDWAYREANPGYQREMTYEPDPEDDPEFTEHMFEVYADKNKKIRESNYRTELAEATDTIERLTVQLKAHGITPVTEEG